MQDLREGDTITMDGLREYELVDRDSSEKSYGSNKLVNVDDESEVIYKSDLQLSVRWRRADSLL